MGHNDQIDFDLHDAIKNLIEEEILQVIHGRYVSLNPKQQTLYDAVVVPAPYRRQTGPVRRRDRISNRDTTGGRVL